MSAPGPGRPADGPPPARALVVDDEAQMRDIVAFALETQGFEVAQAGSAEAAWLFLRDNAVDLVVLDVMLPGRSGVELCRQIEQTTRTPVILLTALGESSQRIAGLEAGAADYVTKPFHPRELALRAAGVVARQPRREVRSLSNGVLSVDLASTVATVGGARVSLTQHEFTLLVALLGSPGQAVDVKHLLLVGWGDPRLLGGREVLKTAVYRLRAKLDAASPGAGSAIRTVRGVGYLIEDASGDGHHDRTE